MQKVLGQTNDYVWYASLGPENSLMFEVTEQILYVDENICRNDAEVDELANMAYDMHL